MDHQIQESSWATGTMLCSCTTAVIHAGAGAYAGYLALSSWEDCDEYGMLPLATLTFAISVVLAVLTKLVAGLPMSYSVRFLWEVVQRRYEQRQQQQDIRAADALGDSPIRVHVPISATAVVLDFMTLSALVWMGALTWYNIDFDDFDVDKCNAELYRASTIISLIGVTYFALLGVLTGRRLYIPGDELPPLRTVSEQL